MQAHLYLRGSSIIRLCLIAFLVLASTESAEVSASSAEAIWAPASQNAKHVFLRPKSWKVPPGSEPERMKVIVSAAPDSKNGGKVLALYKLYVNGIAVGIGPGRGEGQVSKSASVILYDEILVPKEVLAQRKGEDISIALQVSVVDPQDASSSVL